jgi:hypothetical protein
LHIIYMKNKTCTRCKQLKPLCDYYKRGPRLHAHCKKCCSKNSAAYQKGKGKDNRKRTLAKYVRGIAGKATGKRSKQTYKGMFSSAVCSAKYKDINWALNREEYTNLRSKPCHYCKGSISKNGIGLDRIDNSKGYEMDNVVPCCGECNRIRSNRYTPEEMILFLGPAIAKIRAYSVLVRTEIL